jgi:hypothetical protein
MREPTTDAGHGFHGSDEPRIWRIQRPRISTDCANPRGHEFTHSQVFAVFARGVWVLAPMCVFGIGHSACERPVAPVAPRCTPEPSRFACRRCHASWYRLCCMARSAPAMWNKWSIQSRAQLATAFWCASTLFIGLAHQVFSAGEVRHVISGHVLAVRGETRNSGKRGQSPFSAGQISKKKGAVPFFHPCAPRTAAAHQRFHHGLLDVHRVRPEDAVLLVRRQNEGSISSIVTDAEGRPVRAPWIVVNASEHALWQHWATTSDVTRGDAQGGFSLPVLPGTYHQFAGMRLKGFDSFAAHHLQLAESKRRRVDPKQDIEPDAPVTNEHHRLRARLSPLSFEREQPRRSFWARPVRGR